jgi:hypothetical protein
MNHRLSLVGPGDSAYGLEHGRPCGLCSSSNLSQRKKPGDADSATYTDGHHSKDESSPTLSFCIRDFNTRTLAQALHSLVRVPRRVNGIRIYAKIPVVLTEIQVPSGIMQAITHLPLPSTCKDASQYPHVLMKRYTRQVRAQRLKEQTRRPQFSQPHTRSSQHNTTYEPTNSIA